MFWQNYPLLRLAIPFIAGMCGADFFIQELMGRQPVLFGVACGWMVLLLVVHRWVRKPVQQSLFGLTAALFVLTVGALLYVVKYERMCEVPFSDFQKVDGVASQPPVEKAKSWAVEVETEDGRLLAYMAKDSLHSPAIIRTGDSLSLSCHYLRLTAPHLAMADSAESDFLPYRRSLFFKGVSATCYVPADAWQQKGRAEGSWMGVFDDVRQQMHLAYMEAGLEGDGADILEAMTTGNRKVLSDDLRQAYARSGVAHVLALSGFHLTLVLAVFNLLLHNFCTLRWRRVLAVFFIPLIWAFCLLAGMPPSLVRATIMCSIVQIVLVMGRDTDMLNGCAMAAVLMLCVNPLLLRDVGFQLSFVSIVSIFLFRPQLFYVRPERRRIAKFFIDTVCVALVCSLMTFPLVAYYFGQIPLLGVVTNLVISVLVPLLMFGALAWWLLYIIGVKWLLLASGLTLLAEVMNCVVLFVGSLPFATIAYRPTGVQVAVWYVLLPSVFFFWRTRKASALKVSLLSVIALAVCMVLGV